MGKGLDIKSGTFPVKIGSFSLCHLTVQFC